MIYISLGSNLGNRLDNLWESVSLIRKYCLSNIRCSIILETKAILPCSLNDTKIFTSLQKCLEHLKELKTKDKIFMIGG
ncbi:MAG: hypothetical protein ACE1S7_04370, partial [Candidatus Tisiphia sp.]